MVVLVLAGLVLGTKVVPNDSSSAAGHGKFDPAGYAAEHYPQVSEDVKKQAVDATDLAKALADDPAAAAQKYAQTIGGSPVYSVTVKGVAGEGQSGIYPLKVQGIPDGLVIRVQTGPAINGTALRDATDRMPFGSFSNQIDYQNAGQALNDIVKTEVLGDVTGKDLDGKTLTVTGAFTYINPKSWLITPVELTVQ